MRKNFTFNLLVNKYIIIFVSGRKWEKNMFFGSYNHLLDDKNRLLIPSKFRGLVGSKLYILKGYDGCLSLYTFEDFEKYVSHFQELPFENKLSRDVTRIALASVSELEVDKASRVQIPTALISKYSITKEVVVVGMIDHLEVWSKSSWEAYEKENESKFEEKQEKLLEKKNG